MALTIDELCALGVPPELAAEIIRKAGGGGGGSDGSSSTPVKVVSAAGPTNVPIPATGDIFYVIVPTADAQLQFAGAAASGVAQYITISIPATAHTVSLPTANVVADQNVTLPATASTAANALTEVTYRARSGSPTIVGGV